MKSRFLVLIFLSLILGFSACSRSGCMDIDSINYDPDANKDDGSCLYTGQVVFWYGQNTANGLVNDGATSLTFYVNNQVVGSSAANVYWASAPFCGDNGSVTVEYDLGGVKSLAVNYSVRDQTGWEYWAGVINFTANDCRSAELQW